MTDTDLLELNWDDPAIAGTTEDVTEQDLKTAESSGRPPVGKYLCVCTESRARENKMNAYTCFAALLTWEIEQIIEIEGRKPTQADADMWIGKNLSDRVNLYHPLEKEGMRNRRVLIAKRVGLIPPTGGKLPNKAWGPGIIGKRAVVEWIEESYVDKAGQTKTSRKVAFSGYDYADTYRQAVNADDFADI